MDDHPECEHLSGRMRDICRGAVLNRSLCNAYRALPEFGRLPPLPPLQTYPVRQGITQSQPRAANPPKPCCKGGPGTELKAILKSLGLSAEWCIGCQGKAVQMDRWGVAGCRERRELIRGWMLAGMKSATWWETSRAAVLAVSHGMLVDPLDPAGWLVDEAIRRAEAKQGACCNAD